jgi:lipoate-protein ligase A
LIERHTEQTWRHIDNGSFSGEVNMAVDEALLCSFDPELSGPILRTYGWNPPALSLGRFQHADDVLDLERCRDNGIKVVRRVSGGGVIYHADELTYCLVCTQQQIPPAASVKDSFRVLTGFLIEFYRSLGLEASYAVDSEADQACLGARTAFCFAGKETFDIQIDGMKIGGNAQRRLKNVIFQHGSIPIVNRAHQGLQFMRDRTSRYAEECVSLSDCAGQLESANLTTRLVDAFKRHMGVLTVANGLTLHEKDTMQRLLENKYALDQWNLKGDLN